MSAEETIASATAGLLAVIAADREARCRALMEPAELAAAATLATAVAATRRALRQALVGERARLRAQRQTARAQLAAAERQRCQRQAQAVVDEGLALLLPALCRRWEEPSCRERWVAAALAAALARLPPRGWCLRHPPGLSPAEAAQMLRQLAAAGVAEARCEADPNLAAGIAIGAGDATIDASAEGLLAERAAVAGRLLYFWAEPGTATPVAAGQGSA